MTSSRSGNLLIFVSIVFLQLTNAAYIVLTSPFQKCFTVRGSPDTKFVVLYQALGEISPLDDSARIGRRMDNANDIMDDPKAAMNRHRINNNDNFINSQRRNNMNDKLSIVGETEIKIHEFSPELDNAHRHTRETLSSTNFQKTSLARSAKGEIKYEIHANTHAKVCVQNRAATQIDPLFIDIRIKEIFEIPEAEIDSAKIQKVKNAADNHVKFMERELYRLIMTANRLIQATEESKKLNTSFKTGLVDMNSKMKRMTMLQLVIIFATAGFYMKLLLGHLRKKGYY